MFERLAVASKPVSKPVLLSDLVSADEVRKCAGGKKTAESEIDKSHLKFLDGPEHVSVCVAIKCGHFMIWPFPCLHLI